MTIPVLLAYLKIAVGVCTLKQKGQKKDRIYYWTPTTR